ncbi:MAG: hypothetical protein ACYCPW_13025 [Nitrososphaerales archaeon]
MDSLKAKLPSLDACQEIVLLRMYGLRIIGMAYLPVGKIEAKVDWAEIKQKYNCSKDFDRVMDKLRHHALVSDHGKSRQVASLTPQGVAYAYALINAKKYPDERIGF